MPLAQLQKEPRPLSGDLFIITRPYCSCGPGLLGWLVRYFLHLIGPGGLGEGYLIPFLRCCQLCAVLQLSMVTLKSRH